MTLTRHLHEHHACHEMARHQMAPGGPARAAMSGWRYRLCLPLAVVGGLLITACDQTSPVTTDRDALTPVNEHQQSEQTMSDDAPTAPDLPADLAAAMQRHDFRWLGRSEQSIEQIATNEGLEVRIIHRDGEDLPYDRDLVPGRLSVRLIAGRAVTIHQDRSEGGMVLIEGVSDMDQLPFIGHRVDASRQQAEEAGRPWRVSSHDGEQMMLTMDYVPERINAVVVNGMVVAANGG